jgi:integral membrane sensor domain MASE1
MKFAPHFAEKTLIFIGFFMCSISCILITLGLWNFISLEQFAYGLSSGIRVLVSCAIIGCLLSAVGYGIGDHFNNESKE